MSNAELEIDDDHPLALELSSLRTAVARFQVGASRRACAQLRSPHPPPYSMKHTHPHSNCSGTLSNPPWLSSALKYSSTRTPPHVQNSPHSVRTPIQRHTPPSCSSPNSPSPCAVRMKSSLSQRTISTHAARSSQTYRAPRRALITRRRTLLRSLQTRGHARRTLWRASERCF